MLRRRGLIQPQRILGNRVRCKLAGKAMRAEKLIDGFKRNFKRPETERCEAPRIHAHIDELVIAKFDGFRFRLTGHDLRVSRRAWLAIPTGMNANRCSVHGPEHRGAFRISGWLHFNRAISAGKRVFNYLFNQRAKAVDRVRLFESAPQDKKAMIDFIGIAGCGGLPRCKTSPQPDLPVHSRNAIFDDVDGTSHNGCLCKST